MNNKLFLLAILGSSLLLASCGGGDSSQNDSTPVVDDSSVTETTTEATTTNEGTTTALEYETAYIKFSSHFNADTEFTSLTVGKVQLTGSKGEGSNAPKYFVNGSALRLYAKNTLNFSGAHFSEISFESASYSNEADVSFNSGTYDSTNYTWKGDSTDLTLTLGDVGQLRITAITMYVGVGEGGGNTSDSTSDGETYTLEQIANDISLNVFGEEGNYEIDDGDYYIGLYWGEKGDGENQYTLMSAVEDAILYLPDYLIETEAPVADTWGDGSDGVFATYAVQSQDSVIYVEIGSYEEGIPNEDSTAIIPMIVVQFAIYTY